MKKITATKMLIFVALLTAMILSGCRGSGIKEIDPDYRANQRANANQAQFEKTKKDDLKGKCTTDGNQIINSKLPGMWNQVKETKGKAMVYSVVPIPDKVLDILDEAANLRIKVIEAKFPDWQRGRVIARPGEVLPEYEFWFLEPDTIAPQAQQPAFSIQGTLTAGTVGIGCRTVIILPHYASVDGGWNDPGFSISSRQGQNILMTAYNEAEHATEYQNRTFNPQNRFDLFTGLGDQHPHDPEVNQFLPRGLKATPRPGLGKPHNLRPQGFVRLKIPQNHN